MNDEGKTRAQLLNELENARRELENARSLADNSRDNVMRYDRDLRHIFVNRAALEVTGISAEQALGKTHRELGFPADLCDLWEARISAVFETGEPGEVEFDIELPTGVVWLDLRLHPEFDGDGGVSSVLAVSRDITAQKHALQALQASEAQKRAILDGIPSNIAFVNEDLVIQWVNKTAADSVGKTPEEMIGTKCHANWADPATPCDDCPTLRAFETKESEHAIMTTPDGRIWDESGEPVFDVRGHLLGVLEVATDITERIVAEEQRRTLEARVQQSQKLESLGILAGGIAHDFNNILTGLVGNVDLALQSLPSNSDIRPLLTDAQKAGWRAAELTNQMLAYSGRGSVVRQEVDINALLRDLASLLRSAISKKAQLRYDLSADLPAVTADATQLQQIVLNLVTNASEAVGDQGGPLRISTRIIECDRACLDEASPHEELTEGTYVALEVSDDGCGMDDETRAKVFDPFFTTKFTGRGLGMAAAQGIVRGHKGAILVESNRGEGSTFTVLLPALDHAAAVAPPRRREDGWRGTGTILVVDDEFMVRTTATRILERAGFSVLTASGGAKAVNVFRERNHEIVAVLLDLKMPHMDGEETFAELHRINERVPIILSSGYGEQEVTERLFDEGIACFLQKPFQTSQLVEKVREALGEPATT